MRFLRHSLFWYIHLTNYLLVLSINTKLGSAEVLRIILRMPLVIITTYIIIYLILPRLRFSTSNTSLVIYTIVTFLLFEFSVRYYGYYIIDPIVAPDRHITYDVWDFRRILAEILHYMAVICMAVAIKLVKNELELQVKNNELTKEKKEAELLFLRAQMHPHFLFNTLNTLYSSTIQDNGLGEKVVIHLSNLLHFMLEECNKPIIYISQETKVIKEYIELEKMRHGERLTFDLREEIEDPFKLISPLLMLPFIENSCKHTLASIPGKIWISILIKSDDKYLTLSVINDMIHTSVEDRSSLQRLGIKNVQRQLDLLYRGKYILDIKNSDNKFVVYLKFPIHHE
jgi:two-component system, LytTR family, sensor kinase